MQHYGGAHMLRLAIAALMLPILFIPAMAQTPPPATPPAAGAPAPTPAQPGAAAVPSTPGAPGAVAVPGAPGQAAVKPEEPPSAPAKVFRWVDRDGVIHYTDSPPQPSAVPSPPARTPKK